MLIRDFLTIGINIKNAKKILLDIGLVQQLG
jgi:hypothetical protein